MSLRINAARVIAKLKIFEAFINPGLYIAATVGFLLGYFLIKGFIGAIDSSGFNYSLNPFYDLIGRSIEGAMGQTFLNKIFAEGPFLFALYVCFIPMLLFLAMSSVFRFGLEKKVRALELLSYGPADGTSYFMGSLIKDFLFTLLYIFALFLFLGLAALINNLAMGPMFFYSLPLIFLISLAIYALGILASTLTDSAATAVAFLAGVLVFFLIILFGSFTIVSAYVRNVANVFAWIVKWLSPFFYWNIGLRAAETGNVPMYIVSLLLLILLIVVILFLSNLIIKRRGVRV
jgi:hypothetical protein